MRSANDRSLRWNTIAPSRNATTLTTNAADDLPRRRQRRAEHREAEQLHEPRQRVREEQRLEVRRAPRRASRPPGSRTAPPAAATAARTRHRGSAPSTPRSRGRCRVRAARTAAPTRAAAVRPIPDSRRTRRAARCRGARPTAKSSSTDSAVESGTSIRGKKTFDTSAWLPTSDGAARPTMLLNSVQREHADEREQEVRDAAGGQLRHAAEHDREHAGRSERLDQHPGDADRRLPVAQHHVALSEPQGHLTGLPQLAPVRKREASGRGDHGRAHVGPIERARLGCRAADAGAGAH